MKWAYILFISLIGALLFIGCKSAGIFGKRTPHQLYEDKLKKAKLDQTTLGKKWLSIAEISLEKPITISLPFAEKGYFAAEDPEAVTYEFTANRGQRIYISCSIKSDSTVLFFLDLFKIDHHRNFFLNYLDSFRDTLVNTSYYRIFLFNGMTGYAFSKNFSSLPISQKEITEGTILLDYPKTDAIGILHFDKSRNVNIIGRSDSFLLVKSGVVHGWIKR